MYTPSLKPKSGTAEYYKYRRIEKTKNGICIYCSNKIFKKLKTCLKCRNKKRECHNRWYIKEYANYKKKNKDKIREYNRKKSAIYKRGPGRFCKAKSCAKNNKHSWNISKKIYYRLISMPCFYCKFPNNVELGIGLDRIDNKKHYTNKNVVSCCKDCNWARNNRFSFTEMQFIGEIIQKIKLARLFS